MKTEADDLLKYVYIEKRKKTLIELRKHFDAYYIYNCSNRSEKDDRT